MKKTVVLTLGIILLVAGCSVIPGLSSANQPIEITDSTGHQVILDGVPERIAIAGKATIMIQDAIYLFEEADQRVIALENRNQSAFSFLPVIDPNLETKQFFEKNVGPEQIAAAQPDIVIMKNSMAETLGSPLEQLSLPVVYLDLETPDAFYQDINTLGQVFGNSDRADEVINYYQERVSQVEDLVLNRETTPSVLVLE
ncbi:MAG: ABC transporter substrate-binding protein, partial [Chloroflexi bacterium]|nr:ABC transporter substrate-binding protein [Chloroflexota bacterium]